MVTSVTGAIVSSLSVGTGSIRGTGVKATRRTLINICKHSAVHHELPGDIGMLRVYLCSWYHFQ